VIQRTVRTVVVPATVALTSLVLLANCRADPYAAVARHVPTHVDAVAREFLEALASRDTARAEALVLATERGAEARAALSALASAIGGNAPDSLRPLNVEWFIETNVRRVGVTYELAYPDRWVLAQVNVLDSAGNARVFGARVNTVPRAVAAANALTVRGKPAFHYVLALLGVALPLFMLTTAVQVWRNRLRPRWLWAAVALIGVGRLSMNWTTGVLGFQPLYVQLLGAGISKTGAPYMPWVLSVSLPVGALLAQLRLWRRRAEQTSFDLAAAKNQNPEAAT
jgi:hypothetical protein